MLMGCNFLSAVSSLCASALVKRIGAVATMVLTHLPSNVLLALVPVMPTYSSAIVCLLLRFSLSQMDVPARGTFLALQVSPEERSAANGFANLTRTAGLSIAPIVAGWLLYHSQYFDWPFYLSGLLKIVYDLLVWVWFKDTEQKS